MSYRALLISFLSEIIKSNARIFYSLVLMCRQFVWKYGQIADAERKLSAEMIKGDTDEEIVNEIMHFLLYLHKGEKKTIRNVCDSKVLWKYGHSYSNGDYSTLVLDMLCQRTAGRPIRKLVNLGCVVRRPDTRSLIVTGSYRIESQGADDKKEDCFDYTIVMVNSMVVFVQLGESRSVQKIHKVVTVNEEVYFWDEAAILYIESIKDHIVWHCGVKNVEAIDTLKRLESVLSEDFVRVHRSYIVNKKYVFSIQKLSIGITGSLC